MGQVVIPDPNFRQFLVSNHPSVMNPDQTLNVAAAQALTGPFKCYNQNISNLSGIEYFTGISTIEVKYNPNLSTIPNLDGLTNVTVLGLDSNGLTSLPNLSTLVNLQVLSAHHNQLTAVPSLAGLSQITVLFINNNNLVTLPDLSSQINLDHFNCSDNPLTSLPSFSNLVKLRVFVCQRTAISSLPSLNNCPLLEYLVCTNNFMTSMPSITNCTQLIELKVYNCQLTSLPDLSIYPALTMVKAAHNRLSFEDLLPLTSNPNLGTFLLSPQTSGEPSSIGATQFSQISINTAIDNAVTTNIYSWYKNGMPYTTTTENRLTFTSVAYPDSGVYTCVVTNSNPAMAGIVVNTAPVRLTVGSCIMANTIAYSVDNNDCEYPLKVLLDENSFTGGTKPFGYSVKNGTDSTQFSSPELWISKEGVYDLMVQDALDCKVIFPKKLIVHRSEQCDPVFYPNGDGIADTYFIDKNGTAKIFNRNGELVKQLSLPATWDGTNSKGQELPSGLYVIEINNSSTERVTLLR